MSEQHKEQSLEAYLKKDTSGILTEVPANFSLYDEKDNLRSQGLCDRCGKKEWEWVVKEIWTYGSHFLCNECKKDEEQIRIEWISFSRAYEKGILFFKENGL